MSEPLAASATQQTPSLRHSVSWTFAGNVVFSACQWLMLSVLAKLTTPAIVGRYGLGLALTAPVVMFTNLQLRAILATDVQRRYDFRLFAVLRVWSNAVALLVIGGIVLVGAYDWNLRALVLLVAVTKCIESFSDVVYGRLQLDDRMKQISISLMLRGGLSLATFAAVIAVTGSLLSATAGLAASYLVVLLLYDVPAIARDWSTREPTHTTVIRGSELIALARRALPLGVTMMLISLNVNIPRYFISAQLGETALGLFSALSAPMAAGLLVVGALGQSATPRLARQGATVGAPGFRPLLWRLVVIGLLLGVGGIVVALVAGPLLLRILFAREYAQHATLFVWLNAASAIGYAASFLGFGMTALHRFREQVPIFLVAVIATAVTCWIAVPVMGLDGAALALGISGLVQLGGSWYVIERALRYDRSA